VKFFATVKWLNRHGVSPTLATLLLLLCVGAHILALTKMDIVNRQFPLMNARTAHNMALIDFLNGHLWFAIGFAFLFIGSLLHLELRNAPRWSVWLVFFSFAAPCIAYLMVCAYISGKFIFLAYAHFN
jgi:hypothetical protein